MANENMIQKHEDNFLAKIAGETPIDDKPRNSTEFWLNEIAENLPGGGTTVIANPTLAGTEDPLTGLQVGDIKYKVGTGKYLHYLTCRHNSVGGHYSGVLVYLTDRKDPYTTRDEVTTDTQKVLVYSQLSGFLFNSTTDVRFLDATNLGISELSNYNYCYFRCDGCVQYNGSAFSSTSGNTPDYYLQLFNSNNTTADKVVAL